MSATLPEKAAPCKYFDICNLPAGHMEGYPEYCALHCPYLTKPPEPFRAAVQQHLAAGRRSFRHVCFPENHAVTFEGQEFAVLADFRDTIIRGELILRDAHLRAGLIIMAQQAQQIMLEKSTVDGSIEIRVGTGPPNIYLNSAHVEGDILVNVAEAAGANFSGMTARHVTLAGRFQSANFQDVHIRGNLDLRECWFNGTPSFAGTKFEPQSEIYLSSTVISGGLELAWRTDPPKAVHVANAEISTITRIQVDAGLPKPSITAVDEAPRFGGDVTFANVNLSTCRLVRNALPILKLDGVVWAERYWRSVLYDEKAFRYGGSVPLAGLKEGYEILKQQYQEKGNHRTAGDFHYGEMEMRRFLRGGRIWRSLCPEFLYWALSGYGTGYIRAGLILVLIAVGGAVGYWITDCARFRGGFWEALRFSLGVLTFQRPPLPMGFSSAGQWIHVAEAILGPVQVALFALALRMRLKR